MKELQFKQLIAKYLRHELSAHERRQLRDMMLSLNERAIEDSLEEAWETYNAPTKRNQKAYDEVSANLQAMLAKSPDKQNFSLSIVLKIAAVALLLLGMVGSTHYLTKQATYNAIAANEINIATQKGERITMTLPDGTKVTLNAESSFAYPASFGLKERNVRLSGEAYFVVAHDEAQPFIVKTPQVDVKVLGTTFNVNAYPYNDYVETLLVDGKVQLFASNDYNNTMTLLPNQTVRFNLATKRFVRDNTNEKISLGWIRGDMVFRSSTLTDIFEEMERYYGVSIEVDGAAPAEQFVGVFHREEINDVMHNLQVHYQFTYTKAGNHVVVKFNK